MAQEQQSQSNGAPGSGNGNGGQQGPGCGGDEARITDLLVSSFESSVRTAYCMVRIPVVCYANLLDNWCRAIEAATRQCEGGQGGGGNGGGGIGPSTGPGEMPGPIEGQRPAQQ